MQQRDDRPRMLDLFCGAGGATKGYQRSGLYVVGVDVKPQPNYCGDEFHQADADELKEAIPPAYTEWIGKHLMAVLEEAAA
jgi:hypothetical protein